MEIILSSTSGRPIYEQITLQIKEMIMKGDLAPGQALPSMRKLAKDLHVSVITTQRAYDDLQKEGFHFQKLKFFHFPKPLRCTFFHD